MKNAYIITALGAKPVKRFGFSTPEEDVKAYKAACEYFRQNFDEICEKLGASPFITDENGKDEKLHYPKIKDDDGNIIYPL